MSLLMTIVAFRFPESIFFPTGVHGVSHSFTVVAKGKILFPSTLFLLSRCRISRAPQVRWLGNLLWWPLSEPGKFLIKSVINCVYTFVLLCDQFQNGVNPCVFYCSFSHFINKLIFLPYLLCPQSSLLSISVPL